MLDNFRKPERKDWNLLSSYMHRFPGANCAKSVGNIILWSEFYQIEFTIYKDVLLLRNKNEETPYRLTFPVGEEEAVRQVLAEIMEMAKTEEKKLQLYAVTKDEFEKLEQWFPGIFEIQYDRENADYVYETEKLASLSGKKYQAKRNHINRLCANYAEDWKYEPLSAENTEECMEMLHQWYLRQEQAEDPEEQEAEIKVAENSLKYLDELHFQGGVLRIQGKVAAFCIGERACEKTFIVHIEKAFADIQGAYPMINQQFVLNELLGKYEFVNREEDMGIEGLRKAKLSYHPVFLLEKGTVTYKIEHREGEEEYDFKEDGRHGGK